MDKKRLVIFLILAFAMTWLIFCPYILSGHVWAAEGEISAMEQLVCLGMLCPTLAMLLTRYITKEGFAVTGEGSMLLGIRLKGRRWIYLLTAMLLPWIYYELGGVLTLILSPEAFDVIYPTVLGIAEDEWVVIFIQPIAMMVSGAIASFAAFGEEAGWRGYMMPKLIRLCGVPKAILIGGSIWGMWHWPLTYIGHNFGTEYLGYPFVGFAMMCVLCIFIGIILTFLTYRSGSVWPAAILHAVNNSSPSILQYFINQDKITDWKADSVAAFLIRMLPMMVIASIVLVRWVREMKKHKCLCCGYKTLDARGDYDICPVCFWEDDAYIIFGEDSIKSLYYEDEPTENELLDIPSEANHGLTLRQGQENYCLYGACEKEMLPYVRKPRMSEEA
ncbi:MAG: CPBP family glutamic-type intramembrane protease [Muribaculum sp.]|nr:CPBP family glutamic-type intramembrane protease [Muribaculum sp.]